MKAKLCTKKPAGVVLLQVRERKREKERQTDRQTDTMRGRERAKKYVLPSHLVSLKYER